MRGLTFLLLLVCGGIGQAKGMLAATLTRPPHVRMVCIPFRLCSCFRSDAMHAGIASLLRSHVKKHVDSDDVSHQYAMALGDYKNAALRLYDEHDQVIGDFDYHKKVCKMDGRLPHELVSDGFEGERFCVIWFKSYDHRQTEADPIFSTPCYVD